MRDMGGPAADATSKCIPWPPYLQYNARENAPHAILKAIRAGVAFGSGTETSANKAHSYHSKPLDGEHRAGSKTESTSLGETAATMNKTKVVGARRIWGTLKSSSAKNVKSVIL